MELAQISIRCLLQHLKIPSWHPLYHLKRSKISVNFLQKKIKSYKCQCYFSKQKKELGDGIKDHHMHHHTWSILPPLMLLLTKKKHVKKLLVMPMFLIWIPLCVQAFRNKISIGKLLTMEFTIFFWTKVFRLKC